MKEHKSFAEVLANLKSFTKEECEAMAKSKLIKYLLTWQETAHDGLKIIGQQAELIEQWDINIAEMEGFRSNLIKLDDFFNLLKNKAAEGGNDEGPDFAGIEEKPEDPTAFLLEKIKKNIKSASLHLDILGIEQADISKVIAALEAEGLTEQLRYKHYITIWLGNYPLLEPLLRLCDPVVLRIYGKSDGEDILPEGIRNFTKLESLEVRAPIRALPGWIGELRGLTNLNLNGSGIHNLPESMCNLKNLEYLDIRRTNILQIPAWLAHLAPPAGHLKMIDIRRTTIEVIPGPFIQNKGPYILIEKDTIPDHEMNHAEFVFAYYETVRRALEYNEKTRREGILALEEELEYMGKTDFFKYALGLVVDGVDGSIIREILNNFVEREHDPYKKMLKQVQTEAAVCIQNGENPSHLPLRLYSMVDIPGNKVNGIYAAFYGDDSDCGIDLYPALQDAWYNVSQEREEISFINRALEVYDKVLREGILSLKDWREEAQVTPYDIFEFGLPLVIDGEEPAFISAILDNLIVREHDLWKRKLKTAQKAAVLSIQRGDTPRMLRELLLSFFDNHIRDLLWRARKRNSTMPELIEHKNEASKLVFATEAQSLEFTEAIGNIDAKAGINQGERDKKLAKLGKKLFKEHPVKKPPLFKITIQKDFEKISQEVIDELLMTDVKKHSRIIKKTYTRALVIQFKGKAYKIGSPFKEIKTVDIEKTDEEILSEEELALLLDDIKRDEK
jgi:flagellar motor component MotA